MIGGSIGAEHIRTITGDDTGLIAIFDIENQPSLVVIETGPGLERNLLAGGIELLCPAALTVKRNTLLVVIERIVDHTSHGIGTISCASTAQTGIHRLDERSRQRAHVNL